MEVIWKKQSDRQETTKEVGFEINERFPLSMKKEDKLGSAGKWVKRQYRLLEQVTISR